MQLRYTPITLRYCPTKLTYHHTLSPSPLLSLLLSPFTSDHTELAYVPTGTELPYGPTTQVTWEGAHFRCRTPLPYAPMLCSYAMLLCYAPMLCSYDMLLCSYNMHLQYAAMLLLSFPMFLLYDPTRFSYCYALRSTEIATELAYVASTELAYGAMPCAYAILSSRSTEIVRSTEIGSVPVLR
eukprot:3941045-Rhodomonas_salina.1